MARGTDVHPLYQRGLNWKAAQDIHYAWVKVSDGGLPYSIVQSGVRYVPDTHVAGAKAAGIPVGGYHYAQLGPSAAAQADVLLGEIRRLGATGVTPMLDLEAPFSPDATAKAFGIAFCQRIAAAGFRPAVYMNSSFARALRPDQWPVPGLVIVVARYGARPEAPGSAQYTGRYDIHQYSSTGALPGSAGAVDLDDSYTDNHLSTETTAGGFVSGFNPDDYKALMWGNVFDTNGNRNFAAFVKDMDGKLSGLVTSNAQLTKLITDSDANPVNTETLVAALRTMVTGEIGPIVREEVQAALGDDNAQQAVEISDAVIAKTAAALAAAVTAA